MNWGNLLHVLVNHGAVDTPTNVLFPSVVVCVKANRISGVRWWKCNRRCPVSTFFTLWTLSLCQIIICHGEGELLWTIRKRLHSNTSFACLFWHTSYIFLEKENLYHYIMNYNGFRNKNVWKCLKMTWCKVLLQSEFMSHQIFYKCLMSYYSC